MTDGLHGSSHGSGLRSVAVVTTDPRPELLDTVLGAGDYDVVFVEQVSRAYSCIKRTTPQLVIVCLELDDLATFQLLSMLALDEDTANIPVRTYVVTPRLPESDAASIESFPQFSDQPVVAAMN
jgi:DNA-binding response OmpR family regulator